MVMDANREDPNRRFLATQQYWPNGKELIFRFRLFNNQGERPLPSSFVSTHGEELRPMFYVIDELDNCLVLEVIRKNDQLLIADYSFEQIRTFYFIDRRASVQFRYVDGDENNDQDGTLVGDNSHNLIDLSSGSTLSLEVNEQSNATNELSNHRYTPEVYYEKIITASDLGQSRLYLASKFAAYLKLSGDGSIWMITGPNFNVEKNVFFFHLLKSGGRGEEWKFGVGWNECCRVYNLKEGDIITLKLGSIANRQIELSIQRC
ncbi:hypothetical protein S245_001845 [Arachis hypogaea]